MSGAKESNYNEKFMRRAIELSEIAYKSGKGLPIGCVIVKNGEIIGEGHNEIFIRKNPTSHGEMVAIENACMHIEGLQLADCEMYTTLEPCPMCMSAIYWAKLKIVYFANTSKDAAKVGFDDSFIFEELNLSPEKRKIPMINSKSKEAMTILKEWKSKKIIASQPWSGEKHKAII